MPVDAMLASALLPYPWSKLGGLFRTDDYYNSYTSSLYLYFVPFYNVVFVTEALERLVLA